MSSRPHGSEPTDEQEKIAEANAEDVDLAEVGDNYREMTEIGAEGAGEGQID